MARLVISLASVLGLGLAAGVESAAGQWFDARQPGAGELLVEITGSNAGAESRFQPDGSRRRLADVLSLELDRGIEPALDSLDAALPDLFPTLDLPGGTQSSLGVLKFDVLLERTSIPFNFELGITDWLSVFAVVPVVQGRSFTGPLIADGTASAGVFSESPDEFFNNLGGSIAQLESIVAADTLPGARQQEAQALLAEALALEAGLEGLRGLPYVPTDSSAAGREISNAYAGLRAGFADFELELPELMLGVPLSGAEGAEFITEAEFGIETPQSRSTGIKFGDLEAGLRLKPLDTFRPGGTGAPSFLRLRLQLGALWRFPSGSEQVADRLTDLGVGDGQADLELQSALDIAFGRRIWLSVFGGYTIQFDADLRRLLTDPASAELVVARAPDVLRRYSWEAAAGRTLEEIERISRR